MTDADFEQWESAHLVATGAAGKNVREVLEANRTTFIGMHATYEELNECSQRILDSGNIPNWPNEHIAALLGQLRSLRDERAKRNGTYGGGLYSSRTGHAVDCDCPDCNGGEVLPSYDERDAKLIALQDYIVANGGTLTRDQRKKPRRKR